jgi:hypothetical protein
MMLGFSIRDDIPPCADINSENVPDLTVSLKVLKKGNGLEYKLKNVQN